MRIDVFRGIDAPADADDCFSTFGFVDDYEDMNQAHSSNRVNKALLCIFVGIFKWYIKKERMDRHPWKTREKTRPATRTFFWKL